MVRFVAFAAAALLLLGDVQTGNAQLLGLGKRNIRRFNGQNNVFHGDTSSFGVSEDEATTHFYKGAVIVSLFTAFFSNHYTCSNPPTLLG